MRTHLYILVFITVNRMPIHARAHARTLHTCQRARADERDVREECPCISHQSSLAARQRGGQVEEGTEEGEQGQWSILATGMQVRKYPCQECGSRCREDGFDRDQLGWLLDLSGFRD